MYTFSRHIKSIHNTCNCNNCQEYAEEIDSGRFLQEIQQILQQHHQQLQRLSDIVDKQQETIQQQSIETSKQRRKITHLRKENRQQQVEINQQHEKITHLWSKIQQQEVKAKQQHEEITLLRNENSRHQFEINQQNKEIAKLLNESRKQQDTTDSLDKLYETKSNAAKYTDAVGSASTNAIQDPVHACVGESVTLQCAAPQTITVLRGEYGRYADDCTSGCCEPSDADCTELMAEINTGEWQNIKASCDGKNTCDYVYTGQIIDGCALNYTADYLEVLYHCTDFIGFSAYAIDSQNLDEGDVVTFPYTHVNAGGGYNTNISTFTCPTTGFYYMYFNFRVRIQDDTLRDQCMVGIRMDGSIMVTVSPETQLALDKLKTHI